MPTGIWEYRNNADMPNFARQKTRCVKTFDECRIAEVDIFQVEASASRAGS
jgi:hypothetical protein